MPIGAHGVTAVDADGPGPVRNPTAALLKNRHERRDVPGVHHRVEHHVGPTGGHETVPVAVAPPSLETRSGLKRGPALSESLLEMPAIGVNHRRLDKRGLR